MKTFKRRYVPLLVAACFGAADAAPTLPQVVAGQASFSQQGNVFSITNTPGTIINWQSFSINPGEVTRFIQQSTDSAVLNRILGQDPTRILGALQSNGKVFLINPNGVLFGRDAKVDVNGLVASTLNISNADFLAGKKNFTAGANAGEVRNEGTITTPNGGQVFLVAPNVTNAGIITSPKGDVVLAAGHSVQLVDSADPNLMVVVSAPANQAINLGHVVAQGGRIGIFGALVNQRGLVNANSAVVGENGKIVLKASRDTVLEQGSVTSATGLGAGGDIRLLGERVGLDGNAAVDASGAAGGGTVLVGGDWQGKNAQVQNARQTWFGKDASIKADALVKGDGGKVVLWSDGATGAFGSISARGGANGGSGGKVETSGHDLDISGVMVNTGADKGKGGTWLLDPYDIEVVTAGATTNDRNIVKLFANGPSTGVTKIAPATLTSGGGNIMLQAENDLTITDPLAASGDVTALAHNNITVNAPVSSTGGDLSFSAGEQFRLSTGASLSGTRYIDLKADMMALDGTINGVGTAKPTVSFTTSTPNRPIRLRGPQDPYDENFLLITTDMLSRVDASGITVGDFLHMGEVSIDAPFTKATNLVIDNAGSIAINEPVELGSGSSFAAILHGDSWDNITIGGDGSVTAGKSVLLQGNRLNIGGAVESNSVTLMPHRAGTMMSLGAAVEDGFWLDQAKLNWINATDSLTIANLPGNSEGMRVNGRLDLTAMSRQPAKVTLSAGSGALDILPIGEVITGGNITLSGSAGVTVHGKVTSDSGNIRLDAGTARFTTESGARVEARSGDITVAAGSTAIAAGTLVASAPSKIHLPSQGDGSTSTPPTVGSCLTNPSQAGCGEVLQKAKEECVANPNGANCAQVLPKLDECKTNPSALGCNVVIERDKVLQCSINPRGAGCDGAFDICKAKPATPGCDIVTKQRERVEACTATPFAEECRSVLPTLNECRSNSGVFGCTSVLAFDACKANPSGPGCDAVLPPLASCKLTPKVDGCSQVIEKTFDACLTNPNDAKCVGVLPELSQCVADPAAKGCAVVLPKMSECIGSPTLQGCSVVLPKLAQCAVNPNREGCEVVLPKPDFCSTHPLDPTCQVVSPGAGSGGNQEKAPVTKALNTTVNLINSGANHATPGAKVGGGTSASDKASDKQSGPATSENNGAKNEKPATKKLYCN